MRQPDYCRLLAVVLKRWLRLFYRPAFVKSLRWDFHYLVSYLLCCWLHHYRLKSAKVLLGWDSLLLWSLHSFFKSKNDSKVQWQSTKWIQATTAPERRIFAASVCKWNLVLLLTLFEEDVALQQVSTLESGQTEHYFHRHYVQHGLDSITCSFSLVGRHTPRLPCRDRR